MQETISSFHVAVDISMAYFSCGLHGPLIDFIIGIVTAYFKW